MSAQQPAWSASVDLTRDAVCSSCGRRTWSTTAECASCVQVRIRSAGGASAEPAPDNSTETEAETVAADPGRAGHDVAGIGRAVTVSPGLGWPRLADALPSYQPAPLGWVSQPRTSASLPPSPPPIAEPRPITVGPADPPLIPMGLSERGLDPVADRERTMSWWDVLLADADNGEGTDGVGANPGWVKRHWHGVRAILVIMLVSLMAVLYSGTGLVVVWAVLAIPALAVRVYQHRRRRSSAGPTQVAPVITSSA